MLFADPFNFEVEDEEAFELDTLDESITTPPKKRKVQSALSPGIGVKKAVNLNNFLSLGIVWIVHVH